LKFAVLLIQLRFCALARSLHPEPAVQVRLATHMLMKRLTLLIALAAFTGLISLGSDFPTQSGLSSRPRPPKSTNSSPSATPPPSKGTAPSVGSAASGAAPSALPDLVTADQTHLNPSLQSALRLLQKERTDYLAQKADLVQRQKALDARSREEIRARLKAARQSMADQQRQTRADLQQMLQEQRDRLADHKDLIDQAKTTTVRSRKDGSD
jgi:hypothetical protein